MSALGFWSVARRPKWIAVLVLVLVVAGIFAWLGRWQLERAVDDSRVVGPDTELAVPLGDLATPQHPIDSSMAWRRVEVDVAYVPGDTVLLSDRLNAGPERGWTVVAHAVTDTGASLAVALGWSADAAVAEAAQAALDDGVMNAALTTVTGRFMPSEGPQQSNFPDGQRSALSVGELINVWSTPPDGGVYGGYLALDAPPAWAAGLEAIDAPMPAREIEVNLLNIFYGIEWVIFSGVAVFLWWRLVRDEQLREQLRVQLREQDAAKSDT
ncbi:MAG TPA: SURF1 family cytochrome oxidase biogenesis protein [Microbacteriaceae bacterium]|nr:SURF1 family cytochrome oxidase biogenesis protein [Microbacteriaceae bacterium]